MEKFILIPTGIFLQTIFVNYDRKHNYKVAIIFKMLAAFCFVSLSFLAKNKIILIALIFGLLGDFFMTFKDIGKHKNLLLVVGATAFLVEHVIITVKNFGFIIQDPMQSILLCVIIFIILCYLWKECFVNRELLLKIVGVTYILMLSVMTTSSIFCYVSLKTVHSLIFVCGSILFTISDTMLLNSMFGKNVDMLYESSLMVYYIAQCLIALSAFF